MAALRCHLLIGPPASGKTTIAALLAPLLNAELFSTDRIREELYGDAMIQGHWSEVEERLSRVKPLGRLASIKLAAEGN